MISGVLILAYTYASYIKSWVPCVWALILLLMLSGCASLSGVSHFTDLFSSEEDVVEVDEAELAALEATPKIEPLWQVKLGESKTAVFSPIYENGALYAAAENGRVVKLDPATGQEIWHVETNLKLSGGVGFGDGMILLGTYKGEVLAFDESGNSLWQARVTSEVLSPPQAKSGIVVVRTGDGRLFGLDAIDGKRVWIYQGATPPLTVRSFAGVVISRGAIFAGFPGGKLVAINLLNGNVGWESTVAQPHGVTELERMTDISSLPVIDNNEICAVAYHGRVACFDIASGNQIWAKDASSNAGLVMDSNHVYVSEERGTVVAYDKYSGVQIWKQSKLGGRKLSTPMIARGMQLVVGDESGHVVLLSRPDGSLVARSSADDSAIMSRPEYLPDGFVVQTLKGGLYAFRL